jgi:signal transduction histidine kinase/CRP-like cAMP-binding protein
MSQSKGIGPLIKNKLLAGVSSQALKLKLTQSNFLSLNEGEIIYQTGDKSEFIYLILDGEIKLKIINSSSSSTVRLKEKNDFFGEYELVDKVSRKSSAVANTDCVLYRLTYKELSELISTYNAVQEIISSSRNEDNSNTRNNTYIITQNEPEAIENRTVNPVSEDGINTADENYQEINDNKQLSEKTVEKENYNQDESGYENTQPEIKDEIPAAGYDENLPEGNIFSAALSGDPTFRDEPERNVDYTEPANQISDSIDSETIENEEIASNLSKSEPDYQKILAAVKKIYEHNEQEKIVHSIIEALYLLFDVQIARIFLLDRIKNELWSFPLPEKSAEIIKINIGDGLIGRCADDNEIISLIHPETDNRYNPGIDNIDNITAENMLLFPVRDKNEKVFAVIQMFNSAKSKFCKLDEEILNILSGDIVNALEKSLHLQNKIAGGNLSRLQKLTDFITADISAPLNLIRRYAEFICKKTGIKEIVQVSEFIIEQVNTLLTYSGLVSDFMHEKYSLKKEILDLQTTLDNMIDMFAEYAEFRNAKLFKKMEAETKVLLDENIFYNACFQLLKNTCNTLPEGGNIYIISGINGASALIEFRGSGIMIDKEIVNKISASFLTPDYEESTGLSIAIANKIITNHNGKIEFSSESNESTCFTISLPVYSNLKPEKD